jgi:hypothetical protein
MVWWKLTEVLEELIASISRNFETEEAEKQATGRVACFVFTCLLAQFNLPP